MLDMASESSRMVDAERQLASAEGSTTIMQAHRSRADVAGQDSRCWLAGASVALPV